MTEVAQKSWKATIARLSLLVFTTVFGSIVGSVLGVELMDVVLNLTNPTMNLKAQIAIAVYYGHPIGTVLGGLSGAALAFLLLRYKAIRSQCR